MEEITTKSEEKSEPKLEDADSRFRYLKKELRQDTAQVRSYIEGAVGALSLIVLFAGGIISRILGDATIFILLIFVAAMYLLLFTYALKHGQIARFTRKYVMDGGELEPAMKLMRNDADGIRNFIGEAVGGFVMMVIFLAGVYTMAVGQQGVTLLAILYFLGVLFLLGLYLIKQSQISSIEREVMFSDEQYKRKRKRTSADLWDEV